MNKQRISLHFGNEISKMLKYLRVRIMSVIRGCRLRLMGVKVGRRVVFSGPVNTRFNGDPRLVVIHDDVVFNGHLDLRNRENGAIVIGRRCSFDDGLRLVAARQSTITFSEGCSAGMQLVINAGGNVDIGKNCIFSSYVHVNGSAHPIYRDNHIIDQGYIQGSVQIGEDCWLANCTNVLMGARIGKGVIISANTMVGGEISEYSIIAGSPARKIGERPYRDFDLAKPVDDSNCEGNSAYQAAGKSSTSIKSELDYSSAITACRNAFRLVSTGKNLPDDKAPLRAAGELDSIMWFEFLTALESELGVKIPIEVSSLSDFDSFTQIATHFNKNSNSINCEMSSSPWTIFQQFQKLVEQNPATIALYLKEEGGEFESITRSELMECANRFASYLLKCGVKARDRVGIIYPTSKMLISAHLGCLQIGALPSLHPYPSSKVKPHVYAENNIEVFLRIGLRWLYCEKRLVDDLTSLVGVETTCIYTEDLDHYAPEEFVHKPNLEDIAVIQHSSGTTGVQKGVALSHKAISAQITEYSKVCDLSSKDCIISWLPIYHDMGFVACYLTSITTGVPVCMFSPFDWISQPNLFWKTAKKYRATIAWMPNFAFNVLCRATPKSTHPDIGILDFRALVNCSEPVSAQTMREFYDHFEAIGIEQCKLWSCYAMAENTFAVTQSKGFKTVIIDPELYSKNNEVAFCDSGLELVSQGKPIANFKVRIIGDKGEELRDLKVGQVQIRSSSMFTEYYNNIKATDEMVSDGWFSTGDLGFLYEEELYISGRKKDLIIIGGRNFYPQDIEAIANEVRGIKAGRACALGVYNDRLGTESLVVLAERDPMCLLEDAVISKKLKGALLVNLDCVLSELIMLESGNLIKTSSGKVSRVTCKKIYREYSLVKN